MALKEAFPAQHVNDWLVWEPGAWKVPAPGEKLAETRHVPPAGFERPPKGDCLCFELKAAPGSKLKIGRAPENAIVLNDATVSREHVELERKKDGSWVITPLRPAQLNGKPFDHPPQMPLKSGDRIGLGGVVLTYLSQAGFWERIRGEAQKLVG